MLSVIERDFNEEKMVKEILKLSILQEEGNVKEEQKEIDFTEDEDIKEYDLDSFIKEIGYKRSFSESGELEDGEIEVSSDE